MPKCPKRQRSKCAKVSQVFQMPEEPSRAPSRTSHEATDWQPAPVPKCQSAKVSQLRQSVPKCQKTPKCQSAPKHQASIPSVNAKANSNAKVNEQHNKPTHQSAKGLSLELLPHLRARPCRVPQSILSEPEQRPTAMQWANSNAKGQQQCKGQEPTHQSAKVSTTPKCQSAKVSQSVKHPRSSFFLSEASPAQATGRQLCQ